MFCWTRRTTDSLSIDFSWRRQTWANWKVQIFTEPHPSVLLFSAFHSYLIGGCFAFFTRQSGAEPQKRPKSESQEGQIQLSDFVRKSSEGQTAAAAEPKLNARRRERGGRSRPTAVCFLVVTLTGHDHLLTSCYLLRSQWRQPVGLTGHGGNPRKRPPQGFVLGLPVSHTARLWWHSSLSTATASQHFQMELALAET